MFSYRIAIQLAIAAGLLWALLTDSVYAQQRSVGADQTAQTRKQVQQSKALEEDENPELIGKRDINKHQANFYSLEKEVALGRQLAMEMDKETKFVADPIITEYVNRIGQNLVLHSDAKVPFTIKVIDSDEVNAFALPGGFFYVNKGLILEAENEAEIAGVMAHEIAHVAARHGVEQATKGAIAKKNSSDAGEEQEQKRPTLKRRTDAGNFTK